MPIPRLIITPDAVPGAKVRPRKFCGAGPSHLNRDYVNGKDGLRAACDERNNR